MCRGFSLVAGATLPPSPPPHPRTPAPAAESGTRQMLARLLQTRDPGAARSSALSQWASRHQAFSEESQVGAQEAGSRRP